MGTGGNPHAEEIPDLEQDHAESGYFVWTVTSQSGVLRSLRRVTSVPGDKVEHRRRA